MFESLIREAETALSERRLTLLRQASAMVRGEFAGDINADGWALARREALAQKHLRALSAQADLLLDSGRIEEASNVYQALLALDALQESAHRGLMHCYLRSGERALALRQYQQLRELLMAELGAEPDSETRTLYEQIRTDR